MRYGSVCIRVCLQFETACLYESFLELTVHFIIRLARGSIDLLFYNWSAKRFLPKPLGLFWPSIQGWILDLATPIKVLAQTWSNTCATVFIKLAIIAKKVFFASDFSVKFFWRNNVRSVVLYTSLLQKLYTLSEFHVSLINMSACFCLKCQV